MEICKAVTPCVDTPANTHNNQNVWACQRQRSRGGRLDRKHGCITVCHRPGDYTSGVSRTVGSVAISYNGRLLDQRTCSNGWWLCEGKCHWPANGMKAAKSQCFWASCWGWHRSPQDFDDLYCDETDQASIISSCLIDQKSLMDFTLMRKLYIIKKLILNNEL